MSTIHQAKKTTSDVLLKSQALEVKMFIHKDPKEVEKSLGEWLKQNGVTIKHITQSQGEKGGSFIFVLSVFYQLNNQV